MKSCAQDFGTALKQSTIRTQKYFEDMECWLPSNDECVKSCTSCLANCYLSLSTYISFGNANAMNSTVLFALWIPQVRHLRSGLAREVLQGHRQGQLYPPYPSRRSIHPCLTTVMHHKPSIAYLQIHAHTHTHRHTHTHVSHSTLCRPSKNISAQPTCAGVTNQCTKFAICCSSAKPSPRASNSVGFSPLPP